MGILTETLEDQVELKNMARKSLVDFWWFILMSTTEIKSVHTQESRLYRSKKQPRTENPDTQASQNKTYRITQVSQSTGIWRQE